MHRRASWLALLGIAACDDTFVHPSDVVSPTTFEVRVENTGPVLPVRSSTVFRLAVGAPTAGPIRGGGRYRVELGAVPGDRLSIATMFSDSNDWFYAFPPEGVALWSPEGTPLQGDLTGLLALHDAGTERNEPPGVGPNQAPRQPAPNTGVTTDERIRPVADTTVPYGELAPEVEEVIRVELTYLGSARFRLVVANVSDDTTLELPGGATSDVGLSPGVVAVHTSAVTLYDPDGASEGLERLAEDGDPTALDAELGPLVGVTVPLSPGAWAVHGTGSGIFTPGEPASPGLERLAEDGNPGPLARELDEADGIGRNGVFARDDGDGVGAARPGEAFTFLVDARPFRRLSLVTMHGLSNDWFFGTSPGGFPLFDEEGVPVGGEIPMVLWDAGTEVDQPLGLGLDQPAWQPVPDSGEDEGGLVQAVSDGEEPRADERIRVSLRPF